MGLGAAPLSQQQHQASLEEGGGGGGRPPTHARRVRPALTWRVAVVCVVAASGGLLFGYDLGVTGGVMQMEGFTSQFFPHVSSSGGGSGSGSSKGPFCQFADPTLELFTSALFLAGLVAVVPASALSSRAGRRATMLAAGACFVGGVALCAGAVALGMLISGRILLGFGVGLANQAVPIYLSEMAPAPLRGFLNVLFQLATTFGLLAAQLVNLGTARLEPWGWRLSVGLAGAPAVLLLVGAFLLPETPCSLAERGRIDEARRVLAALRGADGADGSAEIEAEFRDIASAAAASAKGAAAGGGARGAWAGWRLLFSRRYLPELISGCAVAAFSQASGINAILFFTPAVFSSLRLGQYTALLSAAAIGGTLFLGTLVSMALVDRVGRRPLLIQGGLQMLASLVGMAALLGSVSSGWARDGGGGGGGAGAAAGGAALLSPGAAAGMLSLMCVFVAGFSWSWGPLGWLIPSEIVPLPARSQGQALFTLVNFAVAFAGTQTFLSLLCAMEWRVYVFFAAWVVLMVLYAALALPETRGVPIERMGGLWRRHWLWRRVVAEEAAGEEGEEEAVEGAGGQEKGAGGAALERGS